MDNIRYGEGQKLLIDIFKHITTLSTFSILLMVAFLRDVFQSPVFRCAVTWSVISFIASILFSICVMILLAHSFINGSKVGKLIEFSGIALAALAIASFISGITTLVLFFIQNY